MSSLPEAVLFRIDIRFQNEIILTCPVDTGRLRSSLVVKTTSKGLMLTMVEYGKHVEFGTFKQRPNPFVRTVIYAKLGKIITEEINRYYGN